MQAEWLTELTRFAIPARAVKHWVPEWLYERFWPAQGVDVLFGHDPVLGWFCLERTDKVKLVFSERPAFFHLRTPRRTYIGPKHRTWLRLFKQQKSPYYRATIARPGQRKAI